VTPLRRQRAATVLFVLAGTGVTLAVAMLALEQDINLFYPPEQVVTAKSPIPPRTASRSSVPTTFPPPATSASRSAKARCW